MQIAINVGHTSSQVKVEGGAKAGDLPSTDKGLTDDPGNYKLFLFVIALVWYFFCCDTICPFCNADEHQLLDPPAKLARRVIHFL